MLDLELNLSPSRPNPLVESPKASISNSSSEILSAESSCVSSEAEDMTVNFPRSLVTTPMLVAGCPRCLMYVLLSEVDPKCPKCKSTVLLDFLSVENTKKTSSWKEDPSSGSSCCYSWTNNMLLSYLSEGLFIIYDLCLSSLTSFFLS